MENVRAKLEEFTEHIETADEQVLTHKNDTLEAIARYEKLEVDLAQAKRRIMLIREDLRHATERLSVQEEKLTVTQTECEEVQNARDEMESHEGEQEEMIDNLETGIRDAKIKCELVINRVVDVERREEVCRAEISRLKEKADKDEARVAVLEEKIRGYGQSLGELEEKEGEMGERESLNEEKIVFLERELKETTVRAEAAERMSNVLQNTNFDLAEEIHKWVTRREDMTSSMFSMDDVADDPAYACFDVGLGGGDGDASGRSTPASIFGAKSEMKFSKTDAGSRTESRAEEVQPEPEPEREATPSPEPSPAPAVKAPEPAKEEAEEEEDEDEDESEEEESDDEGW